MESTKSTSRYILTALAIILVITAFVLVGLNALDMQNKLGLNLGGSNQAREQYKLGYQAAREKLKASCPMVERHSETISGTVTAVSGDKLTFLQDTFDTSEIIDGVKDTRVATVSAATKLQLRTNKPQDQLSKEMAAFKPAPGATPPSPFITTSARLSDIKAGDKVIITSDKDLRLVAEFPALSVDVIR